MTASIDPLTEVIKHRRWNGRETTSNQDLADALLPVVEAEVQRRESEAVAEALRDAADEMDEYVAHAAQEAREWAPDATRVTSWEGKQSAYAWSAHLLRTRAAAVRAQGRGQG